MAEPPLLTLADLSLTFGGDPLLARASLVVAPGERIALVGRNGSGKSTLLKIMAGLVAADAGTRFVRPGVAVGYMAQDPDFSGFATLGAFAAQGLPEHEGWRAEAAMAGLALDPGLAPEAASGGERRRAALARALILSPELILADEPTGGVDRTTGRGVMTLLVELNRMGKTVLVATHDADLAESVPGAVVLRLDEGRVWVDEAAA